MNPIDASISQFFSVLAAHHSVVTNVLAPLANSYFFRGQIIMLVVWWMWFYPGRDRIARRQVLIATLLACVVGLAIGRIMVSTLPHRVRPSDNPVFHFTVTPFSTPHAPESSFPSDHAILFVALATGILLASRRVGAVVLAYVIALICFPRLWLGFHFLSDLLAGAIIGAGLVLFFNQHKIRSAVAAPVLKFVEAKPHLFYTGLFFFSYQVAEMFDPLRSFLSYVHHRVIPLVLLILGR